LTVSAIFIDHIHASVLTLHYYRLLFYEPFCISSGPILQQKLQKVMATSDYASWFNRIRVIENGSLEFVSQL